MDSSQIITIVVCLVFSAFFSGMEIAFISADKLRIELEKKQGKYSSRVISLLVRRPGQYIATMLVGNNIALVVYGLAMALVLGDALQPYFTSEVTVFFLQTVISTLIILITAEFLPKALFRINPNAALNTFSFPLIVCFVLFYPLTKFTMFLSEHLISKFAGVRINDKHNQEIVFGKVDIDRFLTDNQTEVGQPESAIENELRIFQNALDFTNRKVRECMVPRTEIVAVNVSSDLDELRQRFITTGYSKILIYENTIDNVIGYFHTSEFFSAPKDIRSKMIEPIYVPETKPAHKLLQQLIQTHKSVAVVVDEFGGTAGMVTIEDIMEEIFGEIEDEHDIVELQEQQVGEDEYLFSGRLEIDYLNEKYNLNLPVSDEYETVAGYILFHHNNIPEQGTIIDLKVFLFTILNVSDTRIELVNMKVLGRTD